MRVSEVDDLRSLVQSFPDVLQVGLPDLHQELLAHRGRSSCNHRLRKGRGYDAATHYKNISHKEVYRF